MKPKTPEGATMQKERATDKKHRCPSCDTTDFLDMDGRRYFCHSCKKTVKKGVREIKI